MGFNSALKGLTIRCIFPTWPINTGPTLYSVFIRFLKVIVTETVCLAPVIDCSTSPTCSLGHNASRASGGALDRLLSTGKKRHPIYASRRGVISHKTQILSNSAIRTSSVQKRSVMTHFSRIFPLPSLRIQQTIYFFRSHVDGMASHSAMFLG